MIWDFNGVVGTDAVMEFSSDRFGTYQKLIDAIIANRKAGLDCHHATMMHMQQFAGAQFVEFRARQAHAMGLVMMAARGCRAVSSGRFVSDSIPLAERAFFTGDDQLFVDQAAATCTAFSELRILKNGFGAGFADLCSMFNHAIRRPIDTELGLCQSCGAVNDM
tara:strand:- start:347 stop:838 length:492 start_codon:yes stop_codon:yes gene_type:complete